MENRRVIILGASGAGKTTLTDAILVEKRRKAGEKMIVACKRSGESLRELTEAFKGLNCPPSLGKPMTLTAQYRTEIKEPTIKKGEIHNFHKHLETCARNRKKRKRLKK